MVLDFVPHLIGRGRLVPLELLLLDCRTPPNLLAITLLITEVHLEPLLVVPIVVRRIHSWLPLLLSLPTIRVVVRIRRTLLRHHQLMVFLLKLLLLRDQELLLKLLELILVQLPHHSQVLQSWFLQ
jgi:hypothetical protein